MRDVEIITCGIQQNFITTEDDTHTKKKQSNEIESSDSQLHEL